MNVMGWDGVDVSEKPRRRVMRGEGRERERERRSEISESDAWPSYVRICIGRSAVPWSVVTNKAVTYRLASQWRCRGSSQSGWAEAQLVCARVGCGVVQPRQSGRWIR